MPENSISCDIAVLGAGAAGLCAALSVAPGLRVLVLAKREAGRSATALAQGGLAAALDQRDSPESHARDTLAAGAGLSRENVAREVAQAAPETVQWLARQGVPFNRENRKSGRASGRANRNADGIALAREGGHRARRVAHVDDQTGLAIVRALSARVRQRRNIALKTGFVAVNLVVRDGECVGLYALDRQAGKVVSVSARAVILACGGAGKVYLYATTPDDATGDGAAMAFRAGCEIANMEFVQFHPTCLFHPGRLDAGAFLISEAARGEGARIVNARGEGVVDHPDGDLAPRDVVARAIDREMKKTGADCAYLDFSAHREAFWRRRFPAIFSRLAELGIHPPRDRAPIVPAAHYSCGGAVADLDGRTALPRLYAAGEAACSGLHGANRLASNSLLECAVAGRRAGAAASAESPAPARPAPWDERRISPPAEAVVVSHNWEELRRAMWNYVGVARGDERLARARRRVELILEESEAYYRAFKVDRDLLELRNLAQCARMIVEGALSRRESRGLHFNEDCPGLLPAAADTVLTRRMFENRARAANKTCPFSGRGIVANGLAEWRGRIVGFCNPGCRDLFARAAAGGFAGAKPAILKAREKLEAVV